MINGATYALVAGGASRGFMWDSDFGGNRHCMDLAVDTHRASASLAGTPIATRFHWATTDEVVRNEDTSNVAEADGNFSKLGDDKGFIAAGWAADVAYGDVDNDEIWGVGGADLLVGSANNDTSIGAVGDDRPFGGAGTDICGIAGNFGSYTITEARCHGATRIALWNTINGTGRTGAFKTSGSSRRSHDGQVLCALADSCAGETDLPIAAASAETRGRKVSRDWADGRMGPSLGITPMPQPTDQNQTDDYLKSQSKDHYVLDPVTHNVASARARTHTGQASGQLRGRTAPGPGGQRTVGGWRRDPGDPAAPDVQWQARSPYELVDCWSRVQRYRPWSRLVMPRAPLGTAGAARSQGRPITAVLVSATQRRSPSGAPTRLVAALLSALLLAGCSKTVRWDEEVPLNTGETIWVSRTVIYSLQGEGGNPANIRYRTNSNETLSFRWRDKTYVYEGDADLMLLAISPQMHPVLVAPAANNSWDWKHDYQCSSPHYVQLVPDASGRHWSWPPQIEPWLYGMSHNLMRQRRNPEQMGSRYTIQQRISEDAVGLIQFPSSYSVDPNYTVHDCKRK